MWEACAVAKVLKWFTRSPNPEVVNCREDDSISIHIHIVSIKHVCFMCSPTKHKKSLHKLGLQRFLSNFVVQEGDEQWLQQSTVGPGECFVPK